MHRCGTKAIRHDRPPRKPNKKASNVCQSGYMMSHRRFSWHAESASRQCFDGPPPKNFGCVEIYSSHLSKSVLLQYKYTADSTGKHDGR